MIRLFVLVLAASSFATVNAPSWFGTKGNTFGWGGGETVGPGPSYNFVENFETATTGYENTGWTTYGSGNPAADSTAMGFASGQGSQSLYGATGGLNGAFRSDALTGEKWFFWKVYHATGTVEDWHFFGDAAETGVKLGFSSGKLYLDVGGTGVLSAGAFPLDQWVGVWLRYKPGAGGTGSSDAYFAASPFTRPGSPQCSVSGLSNTTEADRPWWLSRSTYKVAWDRIIINATSIGDNP